MYLKKMFLSWLKLKEYTHVHIHYRANNYDHVLENEGGCKMSEKILSTYQNEILRAYLIFDTILTTGTNAKTGTIGVYCLNPHRSS